MSYFMNQQVQQNNLAEQFQQEYQFLQSRRLRRLITLFGTEGLLYYDEDDHMKGKLFNLDQYDYDKIIDMGIEKFQDQIQYYQDQLRIHRSSINNFGVIQYLDQRQLPLFYCHADWDFTLYNYLQKVQFKGQQMNRDTLYWIANQLAYIINLQHENAIFQLNTSIENIVSKCYFNFRFIRFQMEMEGQKEKFYQFILRNLYNLENQQEPSLRIFILDHFFSKQDSKYVLNFNPYYFFFETNRKSQVQNFNFKAFITKQFQGQLILFE